MSLVDNEPINIFTELKDMLLNKSNLTYINLSECNLSGEQLINIPLYMIENKMSRIRRIDLSRNKLTHKKRIIGKVEKVVGGRKVVEPKLGPHTYAEEFCLAMGEFITTDSYGGDRIEKKRLVGLNLSNMNLMDTIVRLAEPIKTANVLASL
jgi:uncharacterized protein YjbI with pentapeptide repeats